MGLINYGIVQLHSGGLANWVINCEALTDADLEAIARIAAEDMLPPFGSVEAIPRGGVRLAEAMRPYITVGPSLIVDDVLTTGRSMERARDGRTVLGLVIFARGEAPSWVRAFFMSYEGI